jgi:hypothetical protein
MAPARETAQALIVGQGDSGAVELASFSVQPMACINRASGPIRLSSTGAISLSWRFADASQVLFGPDNTAAAGWTYTVTNLRLRFSTVDAKLSQPKATLRATQVVRQSVTSQTSTVQIRAPVVADAFSMVMQPQALESSLALNTLVSRRPAAVREARIYLDSTETQLTNRDLKTGVDITQGFLQSMRAAGFSKAGSSVAQALQEGWGMGVALARAVDFARVKSSIRLSTPDVSNAAPWTIYVIYHSVIEI